MEQRKEFALTIDKSKDGAEWQTVAEGHWNPPDQPQITGEVLPDPILQKLGALDLKRFHEGGTHTARYYDWYYRFDLLRR